MVRAVFEVLIGNSSRHSRRSSGGRGDRGVNANDFAAGIDEWAAGIAAVDGRVGLNRLVNESGLTGLRGAANGADHAGGQSALKSERIADSENFLADLQHGGIT